MSFSILSTLKTSVNDYLDNTVMVPTTHVNYTVPGTPGTTQSVTIENVAGIRDVFVQIRRANVNIAHDAVITISATSNVLTIANGSTYTLTAADRISILVIGAPVA